MLMDSEHRIPSWGFKPRLLHERVPMEGSDVLSCAPSRYPRKPQSSADPKETDKIDDRNTSSTRKDIIENTHMDSSCLFPDY